MLAHRLRRWSSIIPTLEQRLVLTGTKEFKEKLLAGTEALLCNGIHILVVAQQMYSRFLCHYLVSYLGLIPHNLKTKTPVAEIQRGGGGCPGPRFSKLNHLNIDENCHNSGTLKIN